MYIKEFERWSLLKVEIDRKVDMISNVSPDSIRIGEVRWVSIGVNIGSEIDGKGEGFTRPCLVMHTVSKNYILVLPMSTKVKNIPGYLKINFQNRDVSICLHQMKIVSHKRVLKRVAKIPKDKFLYVKNELKKFYNL